MVRQGLGDGLHPALSRGKRDAPNQLISLISYFTMA
jgi:hypothetical protein